MTNKTNKKAGRKARRIDWDAVCERTRQRCNKLSDSRRKELVDVALGIIYSAHAEPTVRRR